MKHLTRLDTFERKRNFKEHKEGRRNCKTPPHLPALQPIHISANRGPLVTEQDNERHAQDSLSENLAGGEFQDVGTDRYFHDFTSDTSRDATYHLTTVAGL